MMRGKGSWSAIFLLCFALISIAINAVDVSYDASAIKIDGKRRILFSGSIHYPRSTPEVSKFIILLSFFFVSKFSIISITHMSW